ncbi:uncharacterized protein [Temnothorax nylanderi]|uniref:uncharacterized protein n=1 Tax=Temnothorax nylanderi TaxID=102681 RepID=UPI003A84A537
MLAIHSTPLEPRKLSLYERMGEEDVFENDASLKPSLETSVRNVLRTPQGHEKLHSQLGPLGRRYLGALLSGDAKNEIDHVYGVYVGNDGTMLGDKRFDVNADDFVIVDGVRYVGTPGLYKLIFKRIPDDAIYTENDVQKYRNILLATNAYRRGHSALKPVMGNKGHKYRHIIAPLIPRDRIERVLRDERNNIIDYVHWDDPNELVDRLRLLEASRRAGNDAHGNEIQSVIEELCEVGLIIN